MKDYLLLQNMLEMASKLANSTHRAMLIDSISEALALYDAEQMKEYEIIVNSHPFNDDINFEDLVL